MRNLSILRVSAAPLAMGIALASAPAFAQDADGGTDAEATENAIVVTGSRIARPDLEAASPVTSVTAEALDISGTNSAEEFLRDLPQAVAAIGANTNNGNPGVATIDLRNLGEERTLVLVDGKRFVPYDSNGIVDLNMIPASLIERVDVLTGGASAIYGSDAIAGVVNFVMKSDFEGVEIEGQAGITERGDGFSRSGSVTMGLNSDDGRGNIVLNAGFVKVNEVTQGARDFSRNVLSSATLGAGGGSSTNAAGTIRGLANPACSNQPGQDARDFGVCTFDASGNLVAYRRSTDSFNFNPFNLLLAPQNKWVATAIGRYELSDAIEAFARLSFANSRVTTKIAPSGTFNFPFDIDYVNDPNLTAQARGILATNDTDGDGIVRVPFGRRTVELGTRDSIYENTAYQVVGGFRGDISENLNWEIFAQWGRTARTQTFANDLSFDATQACVTSGDCNLYGAGNLTLAGGNQIRVDLQQYDTTDQTVVGGFLGYDLPFALGGTKTGGIVVGAEYRAEAAVARPDNNLVTGNSIGFGSSTPINSELSVREVYAEAKLPIFDMFSVEGGVRFSDYQNRDNLTGFGNDFKTTSWKVGADFEPVDGIRFRASYQRAVRAPNLNEIGQPITPGTGDLAVDPCQSSELSPADYAAGGALAQLCLATGVPLASALAGTIGGPIAGQINNFNGGNINLTPERSTTKSVGAVFEPSFVPGLSMTIDYFDINVKNAIFALPESITVDACYDVEQDANGFFCQRILRNPLDGSLTGGTETGVISTNVNAGFLRAEGIDFAAQYGFDIGSESRLNFALNLTRNLRSEYQAAPFAPVIECEGRVGEDCSRPLPKWQWVQSTTFETGPLTFQLRWQHIGDIRFDGNAADVAVPLIKARDYFDLFMSAEASDNLTLRMGVNNLLDKDPPILGNDYGTTAENSGNTYPATYDPLGRSYFVGATLKF